MSKVESWRKLLKDHAKFLITVEACGVEQLDTQGIYPLHAAAIHNEIVLVKILIEKKKANIHAFASSEDTALAAACYYGANESAEVLIKAGANVNAQGTENYTPLMQACIAGHPEIIEMLCQAGANISMTNIHGRTAKYIADYHEHPDVVNFLTEWEQKQQPTQT